MRFYRCPQCGKKQAYIGRPVCDCVSVDCRSRACIGAVVSYIPGEPVEGTLRRAYAEWTRKLMASIGNGHDRAGLAGALAEVEGYKAELAADSGVNDFPPTLDGVVDLMRVALEEW